MQTSAAWFGRLSRPASSTARLLAPLAGLAAALVALAPSVARADEPGSPLSHYPMPAFKVGFQGGMNYWTEHSVFGANNGATRALAPGYLVGARASLELLSWLALDARGTIMHNDGLEEAGGGGMLTVGGWGAVRLTAPLDHVRPYALVGGGYYHYSASGPTTLLSGSAPAVVAGFGAMVPVGRGFDVGFEYSFSFLIGETLSSNENVEGGDPNAVTLFVQYRLSP